MNVNSDILTADTLDAAFFAADAPTVARRLLGHLLVHDTPEGRTAGLIVETEAYDETDPASHSCRGRTPRNAAMFGPGGWAYVYRSYGIHWCINVSCGPDGFGAAALLRALQPLEGQALMAQRRGLPADVPSTRLARGPGCLTQAMGITLAHNNTCLLQGPLRLIRGPAAPNNAVRATPRIGITKAATWPWRFVWLGNPHVSGPRTHA